jgi:hypothetical protein
MYGQMYLIRIAAVPDSVKVSTLEALCEQSATELTHVARTMANPRPDR